MRLCLLAQVETTELNVCIPHSYFKSCTHFLDVHHKAPCKVLQALKTLEKLVYQKGKIKSTEIWEGAADSSRYEPVKKRLARMVKGRRRMGSRPRDIIFVYGYKRNAWQRA